MAKQVSLKCIECSKKTRKEIRNSKPSCYVLRKCSHKRNYYRTHERNRARQREQHIYIKYAEDKCAMCNSDTLLEVHHIIPQMLGAEHTRMNTLTLCYHCHKIITKYYNIVLGRQGK